MKCLHDDAIDYIIIIFLAAQKSEMLWLKDDIIKTKTHNATQHNTTYNS